MPESDVEVVVVGGGAAGVAAAKRLMQASIGCLLVEARPRLGGRAYTVIDSSGFTLDLAALRRSQSVGPRRGRRGRSDRQDAAAMAAPNARIRLPARRAK
jgi:monoamine oxidase